MSKESGRSNKIHNLFKNIVKKYGDIQRKMSDKTQEFGYSKDVFKKAGVQYKNIPDSPLLDGVAETLSNHFKLIEEHEKDLKKFLDNSKQASIIAFSTATSATISILAIHP